MKFDFPDLSKSELIGLDTETKDPNLKEMGPGDIRGDGHVAGISLAVPEGDKWYLPIAHEQGDNLDTDAVARYLRGTLRSHQFVTGANLGYDRGWLRTIGVTVPGIDRDTQLLEPLIDEEQAHYSLEALSQKYLGVGKTEDLLLEAAREAGFDNPKGSIWRLPHEVVAPYAEDDAWLAVQIYQKQIKEIEKQDLTGIMDLESALSPVLDEMRWRGVRVDLDRADEYNTRFTLEENNLLHELQKDTGFDMNPWSPDDLVRVFDSLGVSYPTTEKGNPSFEGEWLESMGDAHPTSAKIAKYRRLNKMRRDFIEGGVLRWQISGRIHGQIHALRRDDYGTRSGRSYHTRWWLRTLRMMRGWLSRSIRSRSKRSRNRTSQG